MMSGFCLCLSCKQLFLRQRNKALLTEAGAEWKQSHPAAGHHQRDAVGITVTTAKALNWKRCVTAGKHKHQSENQHSPQGNVFIFQAASTTQRKIIEGESVFATPLSCAEKGKSSSPWICLMWDDLMACGIIQQVS